LVQEIPKNPLIIPTTGAQRKIGRGRNWGNLNARLNYTLILMKFIIGGYVWYMVT